MQTKQPLSIIYFLEKNMYTHTQVHKSRTCIHNMKKDWTGGFDNLQHDEVKNGIVIDKMGALVILF